MADPQQIHADVLFESSRFTLQRERYDTEAGLVERPVIHHPGAVAILAQPNADEIVLVRQFRYPIQRWTWEIPAGTREPNEDALLTAQRELGEEANLAASDWQELGRFFPAVGVSDEEMVLYRAGGLRAVEAEPDHGEFIDAHTVPLGDVDAYIADGRICDGKTLLAISLLRSLPQPFGRPCLP